MTAVIGGAGAAPAEVSGQVSRHRYRDVVPLEEELASTASQRGGLSAANGCRGLWLGAASDG